MLWVALQSTWIRDILVATEQLCEGGLDYRAMGGAQGIHCQGDLCHTPSAAHCLQHHHTLIILDVYSSNGVSRTATYMVQAMPFPHLKHAKRAEQLGLRYGDVSQQPTEAQHRVREMHAASELATDLLPKYSGLPVFQRCLHTFQATLQGICSNLLRWHVLRYGGNNISQLIKST